MGNVLALMTLLVSTMRMPVCEVTIDHKSFLIDLKFRGHARACGGADSKYFLRALLRTAGNQ